MTGVVFALLLSGCPRVPHAELAQDAALVATYARRYDVDPLLAAAVMIRESTCRRNARSSVGLDWGLMQVRRGVTTRDAVLTDAQLMEPRRNIALGIRRLARARRGCGGGPPERWLGAYAGLRGCRPSEYATRVLATMATTERMAER